MRGWSGTSYVYGARAIALFCITAAAMVLGLGLTGQAFLSANYFWNNAVADASRVRLLGAVLGAAALVGAAATVLWVVSGPRDPSGAIRLNRYAERLSPLGPLAFVPCLLRWDVWHGHDLAFLFATLIVALAFGMSVKAAIRSSSADVSLGFLASLRGLTLVPRSQRPALTQNPHFWLGLIGALSFAYMLWFSYYTSIWHLSVRSGFDTAIEDSILYNLTHGFHFYKAGPALGPTGSHFRRHATLISYVIAPFYALSPGAATVLVIQAVIQGAAAIPLFLFARRRLGDRAAAFVAVLYLFHPALQQSNLFEVHYVKFGPPFFFLTLWLLDSGRTRWALGAAALTLMVREDVATWVILLGVWALFSGRSPVTGLLMAAFGGLYVAIVKGVIMPSLAGGEDELMFMYTGLLPEGKASFAWVMATVFGNPAFTLESLFDLNKLVFFLQVLVPLALIPLRRPIGWFALIPGGIFCFLSTDYPALVDIHFQYSAHLLSFLFPALVLVLEGQSKVPAAPALLSPVGVEAGGQPFALREAREEMARKWGAYASLGLATLVSTYQYGAVLQQNTSRGGPMPYKFGWDDEGRARRRSIDALLALVPPDGKVAGSAFAVPQISTRPNGYSLSISLYDADWIVAPSGNFEYVSDEAVRTRQALESGKWGVVKVVPPFLLARRGHSTELNRSILDQIPRP